MDDVAGTVAPQGKENSGGGIELGVYTFGELNTDPHTGEKLSAQKRILNIINEARLADELGLDVFGVGEHHRLDFAVSSPAVVLSAIAALTQHIKLTSAVTVLSSADPVRVFEDFATLDLISGGRAEILAGRGAFVESFPLFGYDLNNYDELFAEHIDLLMLLNKQARVSWQGHLRPSLEDAAISPRPLQAELPIWIGVGGTPQSAIRAGMLGLPMMLAIIGGEPARFAPLVDLYRRAGTQAGHPPGALKVGVSSHFHVQKDSQRAKEEFYPYYAHYFSELVPSRRGLAITRADYEALVSPRGALFAGSPQEIIDKILYEHNVLGLQRFMGQLDIGGMPYGMAEEAIRLFATEVAPVVRRETAGSIRPS